MKKESLYIGFPGTGKLEEVFEDMPDPETAGFTIVTEQDKPSDNAKKVICFDESK